MSKFLHSSTALAVALLALVASLHTSCVNVDNTLGYGMVPPSQQVGVKIDTFQFFTLQTVRLDTIISTAGFTNAMLGRITDDRLGKSRAGVALQFLPRTPASLGEPELPSLPDGIRFDSAVLTLNFGSVYTSFDQSLAAQPMTVELYELEQSLRDSVAYKGVSDLDKKDNLVYSFIASRKRVDNLSRPSIVTKDSVYVQVPIDHGYLERIGAALKESEGIEDFQQRIKGMYITVDDQEGGAMMQLSRLLLYLESSNAGYRWVEPSSRIRLHGSFDRDTGRVDTIYYLIASVYQPRFAVYEHQFEQMLQQHGHLSAQEVYTQGLYGVQARLEVDKDSLTKWLGTRRISIDRAELVLPVLDETNLTRLNRYPKRLQNWNNRGDTSYVLTRDMADMNTFNGRLNRSNMHYSINMTHQLNDLMRGNYEYTYILSDSMIYAPQVGVLRTQNSVDRKPMLKVTYTEMP